MAHDPVTGLHGLFPPLDTKIGPVRDAPPREDPNTAPFGGYRGPLVDSVTAEVAGADPNITPPFVRLSEGDVEYPELRALVDLIFEGDAPVGESHLPRATANEDSATYSTPLSEFEAYLQKMDKEGSDDDPPDGDVPDSATVQSREDDEDENEGKIAA